MEKVGEANTLVAVAVKESKNAAIAAADAAWVSPTGVTDATVAAASARLAAWVAAGAWAAVAEMIEATQAKMRAQAEHKVHVVLDD